MITSRILAFFMSAVFFLTSSVLPVAPRPSSEERLAALSNEHVEEAPSDKEELLKTPYMEMVKEYAHDFGLDFRLVLALIKQESQFDPDVVSDRGALGLMQIMPPTGDEISEKLNLQNVRTPRRNVEVGIYYFAEILELFKGVSAENRLRLSLAAYYAGPSRIYDAQEIAAYMGENPNSWASVKSALPLLSKRFYSLHQAIWEGGRPKNGFFGGWRQTLAYVDNVMANYQEFQRTYN